jgi:zinc transport system permease protein
MTWVRVDLLGLLFGDILAVSTSDIWVIWVGGALVLACLAAIWKPLFAETVSADLAVAEGLNPQKPRIIFMILLALVISISIKVVGVLLITGMLILPAAVARNISAGPIQMVILSVVAGIVSVVAGLFSSLTWNTSSGPSIIATALVLFILTMLPWPRLLHNLQTRLSPR